MATPIVTSLNPIEENITYQKTPVSDKFYTSKLLNYVESVEIGGYRKTVFYTELNTNFNIGDRVFIVNGNYDSGEFIKKDKYTRNTDGYKVLGCDGCRLILDLDYNGVLPYISDKINTSIKVYHIRTQREFDYINSIQISHNSISFTDGITNYTPFSFSGRFSKFEGSKYNLGSPITSTAVLFSDSIIYIDGAFTSSAYSNALTGNGFFFKQGNNWIDITSEVISNNIRLVNPNYSNVENKLYIKGEDFIYSSLEFKQRNVYTFDGSWILDIKYKIPYVSRLNFRYGKFKGKHNDGIFGTNLKKNNWDNALWNSGAFINSNWNIGDMNSKSSSGEKSYYSTFKSGDLTPVQTIDFSNNKGFGYNLIEDSTILGGEIKNGNIENCNLGMGSTYSALDIYFGLTHSFGLKLGGIYKYCDINNVITNGAKFVNSLVYNSNIYNSRIVNSQITNSSSEASIFSDEEGIVVLSSDIWSYNTTSSESTIKGILKLYISDEDAEKVSSGDAFYLTRLNKNLFLNSLTGDQKIKLPIETKFLFDVYSDYELDSGKIIVSIKNKNDNKVKTIVRRTVLSTNYNTIYTSNSINFASIDIEGRCFGWYEETAPTLIVSLPGVTPQVNIRVVNEYILSPILPNNINGFFTNTYVRNADYKNGYFNKSNWLNGANINYKHNVITFDSFNNLNIQTNSSNSIQVRLDLSNKLNSSMNIPGEDISIGDIVWLDSINHNEGSLTKSIQGKYKVINKFDSSIYEDVILSSLDGLTFSFVANYDIDGAEELNYASIHKFRIDNSTINSGLLSRTSIKNTSIVNVDFNNNDRNLDILNIERLRLINTLFKDSNNKVESGYIFKSHFINDIWNNGVIYNSIWNGGTFGNGVFNSGYWKVGNFKNGAFINSKDITPSIQSYDNGSNLYRTWLDGVFDFGEFYNSTWLKGTFNNGRFHNSEWYTGTFNNGILGSSNLRVLDTKMSYSSPILGGTSTVWNNGIVENATVGGYGSIYWYNGKFNDGEFTSFNSISNNESIWYNGEFNNGKFTGLARWKNGKFFKGKFHSHYGYTYSSPITPSTYSTNYSWEDGKFLGGEFGNASTGTNSVWYNGDFSGGIFQGRLWYKGLFTKGEFFGSGDGSSIYDSNKSNQSEYNFVDSFRNNYYGLWYNGIVSDNPKSIKTEERVFTELVRKVEEVNIENPVSFKNSLWVNGTFSHKNGTFQNSIWMNGYFYDGTFDSSIFNPYVDRTFSGTSSSSFATTQSCVWYGGKFDSTLGTGSFYISDWRVGTFNKGYMSGATWKSGVWNYGTAENIIWLDGLWRNGNWNSAPFNHTHVDRDSATFSISDERVRDIIINVGENLDNNRVIYLNNVFSASNTINILTDQDITNSIITLTSSTASVFSYNTEIYDYIPPTRPGSLPVPVTGDRSDWEYGTTFSINSTQSVTETHVYTNGGTLVPGTTRLQPESNRLYAKNNIDSSLEVFTFSNAPYIITIQLTVEDTPSVDVFIKIGEKSPIKLTLDSRQEIVNNRVIYYPKQYNLDFIHTTPATFNTPSDKQFYIEKGRGGRLRVLYLDIVQRDYEYHPVYNNATYSSINFNTNQVILPSDNEVELLGVSTDANLITVNIGNGLFKSGIWENGIWNNGFRSNSFIGEVDYYRFSNIVGLNGIFPYSGKGTYQIDGNTWLVTIKALDSLNGLNVGDMVAIGNLVAIDINESRKLIKDYFTIKEIDTTNNTVVVELVSNFPILRVEKDSSKHLIYVTKNIWLSGVFLNGQFSGVWNNGLFKGYPRIGVMYDSQWIDGKFDGGRFISRPLKTDSNSTYQSGLIQNFTFIDNNQSSVNQTPLYTSWMDLNYSNKSKSKINQFGYSLNVDNSVEIPSNSFFTYSYFNNNPINLNTNNSIYKLNGFITDDVLESISSFRDVSNTSTKYKLGTKFTKYQNLIPNDGNFNDPFSNRPELDPKKIKLYGDGVDLTNFVDNGWSFIDLGFTISSTNSVSSGITASLTEAFVESNVDELTINKLRISASGSALFYQSGSTVTQSRISKVVLQNSNIKTIRNRYYLSSINLDSYTLNPATWSTSYISYSTMSYINISSDFGLESNSLFKSLNGGLVDEQYFYNKRDLSLNIYINSTLVANSFPVPNIDNNFDILFNNISFYELDMIPFFNYFNGDINLIDTRIKTPWFATAPFIDYSNADFDFLGNVNLTIDSELVNNQAEFSIISVGGVSGTINVPPGTLTPEVASNDITS